MPDLLVGVGGGDDDRVGRWPHRGTVGRVDRAAECVGERGHLGVDGGHPGPLDEDPEVGPVADRREQIGREPEVGPGQQRDRTVEQFGAVADAFDREREQVGLVEPVGGQPLGHHRTDPSCLAASPGRTTQERPGAGPGEAHLAMQVAQAGHRRWVLGDECVVAGRRAKHLADHQVDQRRGDREPARRRELGTGDPFREPSGRDQLDRRDASVRPEPPASGDADRVRRHDDRDRHQRIVALGVAYGLGQRSEGLVGTDGGAAEAHDGDRTQWTRSVRVRRSNAVQVSARFTPPSWRRGVAALRAHRPGTSVRQRGSPDRHDSTSHCTRFHDVT